MSEQRTSRKGKGLGLSEERTTRLEALGFVWDLPEAVWGESYRRLEAYRAEQGDCLVPCPAMLRPMATSLGAGSWGSGRRTSAGMAG